MDAIGGRKLVISAITVGVGLAVTLIKGDIPANLLQLLQVVSGAYMLGNVGVKVFGKNFKPGEEEVPEAPSAPQPANTAVSLPEGPTNATSASAPSTPTASSSHQEELDIRIQAVNNRIVIAEQKIAAVEKTVATIGSIILNAKQ